eukprot:TRINITY_DN31972_c0_g1_i1.p1 TRINITY_DN31972_c0_g1~~TRINITY_DN31972_c0_g1_i1.p1  ORF type:complete len:152 (+),score=31.13 TRINITY_DN31972_c0_g1_i1:41-496(+)
MNVYCCFFFQAEDGIRDAQESRGLGDVYKRQEWNLHLEDLTSISMDPDCQLHGGSPNHKRDATLVLHPVAPEALVILNLLTAEHEPLHVGWVLHQRLKLGLEAEDVGCALGRDLMRVRVETSDKHGDVVIGHGLRLRGGSGDVLLLSLIHI